MPFALSSSKGCVRLGVPEFAVIFTTYILRCSDGSYYIGHTDNFEARLSRHQIATAGYVAPPRSFAVVWTGEFEPRADALAFKLKLKGWLRAKKAALIAGDWNLVSKLSRTSRHGREGGYDGLSPNGTGNGA
ncbi:MAG: GIY-YIG nuclease family protein [Burkholderiales bacterium]|nr:GIY-YIG nuclease family protein [Burkholderiales bacterium]